MNNKEIRKYFTSTFYISFQVVIFIIFFYFVLAIITSFFFNLIFLFHSWFHCYYLSWQFLLLEFFFQFFISSQFMHENDFSFHFSSTLHNAFPHFSPIIIMKNRVEISWRCFCSHKFYSYSYFPSTTSALCSFFYIFNTNRKNIFFILKIGITRKTSSAVAMGQWTKWLWKLDAWFSMLQLEMKSCIKVEGQLDRTKRKCNKILFAHSFGLIEKQIR